MRTASAGRTGAGPTWLTEPARPEWLRAHPKAYRYALATVCVGAFMGQLDASIVTVAFPTLQRSFHASLGSVTWVGLSYLVVLVAGVAAVGRLADMVGRKLLYTYGFLVFIVGSGLCALAPSLPALDGFRAVQALGAAMLQANSIAILYLVLPPDRLGKGLGIQGAAQAAGLALGPTVGGLLLAVGGWRLIFFVNVPAGLVGALAAWMFLPRSRDLAARTSYDWRGLCLYLPAVTALLVAVSFGSSWGWASLPTLACVGAAIACGLRFVRRERRVASPLLDLSLFKQPGVAGGMVAGLLSYLLLFGTMFAVPFFLERARHLSAAESGLVLTLLPLALGVVAPIAGRRADRWGARRLAVSGMTLDAGALAFLAAARPSGVLLAAALAVIGIGLGLFIAPNTASVMASVPRAQAGMASGVLNMTRGLGTAFGLAVTSALLASAGGTAGSSAGSVASSAGSAAVGRSFAVAVGGLALVGVAAACVAWGRRRPRCEPPLRIRCPGAQ